MAAELARFLESEEQLASVTRRRLPKTDELRVDFNAWRAARRLSKVDKLPDDASTMLEKFGVASTRDSTDTAKMYPGLWLKPHWDISPIQDDTDGKSDGSVHSEAKEHTKANFNLLRMRDLEDVETPDTLLQRVERAYSWSEDHAPLDLALLRLL